MYGLLYLISIIPFHQWRNQTEAKRGDSRPFFFYLFLYHSIDYYWRFICCMWTFIFREISKNGNPQSNSVTAVDVVRYASVIAKQICLCNLLSFVPGPLAQQTSYMVSFLFLHNIFILTLFLMICLKSCDKSAFLFSHDAMMIHFPCKPHYGYFLDWGIDFLS